MKRWIWLGLGLLVGIPVLLCGGSGLVGLLLDPQVELAVEEELQAPPAAVFALLDDAQGLAAWWDVAQEAFPAEHRMEVVAHDGPDEGVGTRVDFVAGGMAAETWEILEVSPPDRVVYDVDFKIMRVERTLTLTPSGTGTTLRWSETGRIGNPWIRVMMAAMGAEGAKENFRGAIEALDRAAGRDPSPVE